MRVLHFAVFDCPASSDSDVKSNMTDTESCSAFASRLRLLPCPPRARQSPTLRVLLSRVARCGVRVFALGALASLRQPSAQSASLQRACYPVAAAPVAHSARCSHESASPVEMTTTALQATYGAHDWLKKRKRQHTQKPLLRDICLNGRGEHN